MAAAEQYPARIRPATATDVPALGELGARLVAEHYAFDERRFIAPAADTAAGYGEYLRTQLRARRVVLLVAEVGGAVRGYAYAGLEGMDYMALRGPAGVLYDVLVAPDWRGRGLGQQLLTAALAALAARGAPRVVLATAFRNEAAQRLFARNGFRPTMVEMTREMGGEG